MSDTSLIYRSVRGYELVMRALYGRHYAARLRAVADEVPDGAEVLELCCGPGTLYERHLRSRVRSYIGLDVNPQFIARLRARGVDARQADLSDPTVELPGADVVIIQASLYHFLPDGAALIDRMLAAARERVIVAEPVRNLASSRLPLIGALGRRSADPGAGAAGHAQRFNANSLAALMGRYRERQQLAQAIPGGREHLYVLDARSARRSGTAGGS